MWITYIYAGALGLAIVGFSFVSMLLVQHRAKRKKLKEKLREFEQRFRVVLIREIKKDRHADPRFVIAFQRHVLLMDFENWRQIRYTAGVDNCLARISHGGIVLWKNSEFMDIPESLWECLVWFVLREDFRTSKEARMSEYDYPYKELPVRLNHLLCTDRNSFMFNELNDLLLDRFPEIASEVERYRKIKILDV